RAAARAAAAGDGDGLGRRGAQAAPIPRGRTDPRVPGAGHGLRLLGAAGLGDGAVPPRPLATGGGGGAAALRPVGRRRGGGAEVRPAAPSGGAGGRRGWVIRGWPRG